MDADAAVVGGRLGGRRAVVAQVVWFVLDGRTPWLHALVAVATLPYLVCSLLSRSCGDWLTARLGPAALVAPLLGTAEPVNLAELAAGATRYLMPCWILLAAAGLALSVLWTAHGAPWYAAQQLVHDAVEMVLRPLGQFIREGASAAQDKAAP